MVDKKRKQVKKKRNNKVLLIVLVGLLIGIAVVVVVMFDALKNPEKDTMRKCIAFYAMEYDAFDLALEKPLSEKGFKYAKEWCEMEKQKYSNESDFEADINNLWHRKEYFELDGHDRNWYYDQVKL